MVEHGLFKNTRPSVQKHADIEHLWFIIVEEERRYNARRGFDM